MPSFDQELLIPVAVDRPVVLSISDPQESAVLFSRCNSDDEDHVTLLILAWISARWAEIIPGVSGPVYSGSEAEWDGENIIFEKAATTSTRTLIDLGDIDDGAARWWAAILATEGG